VVSLFVPGAGLIKAVIGIYDTVVFFIQKAKQIAKMVGNFLGSIGEIAAGNIGAAAEAMENGLARGLSLVISFLAQLLHLNGITAKIRDAIQKIRDKVDTVLLKVANWIADKAKKLFGAVKTGVAKLVDWWREKQPFKNDDGEKHTLLFEGTGEKAKMAIRSDPQAVEAYLSAFEQGLSPDDKKGRSNLQTARSVFDRTNRVIFTPLPKPLAEQERRKQVKDELAKVSAAFARLAGNPPKPADYPKSTEPDDSKHVVEYIVGDAKLGFKPKQGRDTGTPGWQAVYDAGLTTATDRWVQMHVISEQLGGKGVPANLIPAPNSINTGPFRSFEHSVKTLAKAKSAKINNVVWVKVEVVMEGVYAKRIRGQAGLYFWKGASASPKWIKNDAYSLFSQAAIPAPQFGRKRVISLNFSSGTEIANARITSNATLIRLIKEGRRYPSLAVFASRMEERAAEAGVANHKAAIQAILAKDVVLNEPAPNP
jgi:hypothetical protein